jgi:hypothetical protein
MGHMPLSRKLAISLNPKNYGTLMPVPSIQIAITQLGRTTTVRARPPPCAKTVQP